MQQRKHSVNYLISHTDPQGGSGVPFPCSFGGSLRKGTALLLILWLLRGLCLSDGIQGLHAQRIQSQDSRAERLRPLLHFTPEAHWINDPNGLVYIKGTYHMFYQYYPEAINWGPMHWGHAISRDLIHWQELPIALYPDSLGYIFSGSAVYDQDNTSGLGSKSRPPLVAIFTHHDPKRADAGREDVERQSIAYSLDEGLTWIKYPGNPVVQNPGVRDFRDPKVFWYAPDKKWIMVVAASDRVRLYSSKNLTRWQPLSEFGSNVGSHASVWECPDLFPLLVEPLERSGKTSAKHNRASSPAIKWVLTVSEGNGGPNKGSGIQYFVGDFDGTNFISPQKEVRWLEYGPDDYAGNTWNGLAGLSRLEMVAAGKPRVGRKEAKGTKRGEGPGSRSYIGWMTNLMYAGSVPATTWRGEMTLPRILSLVKVSAAAGNADKRADEKTYDRYYLRQTPVGTLQKQIASKGATLELGGAGDSPGKQATMSTPLAQGSPLLIEMDGINSSSFKLVFRSPKGDSLVVGLEPTKSIGSRGGSGSRYYINRGGAGDMAFARDMNTVLYGPVLDFAAKQAAGAMDEVGGVHANHPSELPKRKSGKPHNKPGSKRHVQIILDRNSVELFADGGLSVMTALIYPRAYFDRVDCSLQNFSKSKANSQRLRVHIRELKPGR
ncbi:Sucrose-6-phosphate hydrolase SacC, GH32 family [Arachidicoccus rhizosphaerae]|uniref:Sucrose-6-phosphate hydrolase SacC, GH32 family n=1 Tax=Arachidicoccus rhizosphaerae TaxID=551991 RepID=A0A1H4AM83_9BACT|nr:glycoside hydrolase family 32 protein [Arachidicoccus rhizosphaerae]SEA36897.1 Sucrose-6-phosphate hydrolase SacC, GH32 family [Arachidicoccus rhizosphaerae]